MGNWFFRSTVCQFGNDIQSGDSVGFAESREIQHILEEDANVIVIDDRHFSDVD